MSFTSSDTFKNLPQGFYSFLLKDANGLLTLFSTSYCYRNGCPFEPPGSPPYFGPALPCSFIAKAYSSGGSNCNNSGSIGIDAYPLPSPQVSYPAFYYSMDGINYFPTNTTEVSTAVEDSLAPGLYKIYFKDSIGQKQLFSVVIPKYCEVQITFVNNRMK